MQKCDFNKVALQLYRNHTLAWVVACKFAAYFQNIFSQEYLWRAPFVTAALSFHLPICIFSQMVRASTIKRENAVLILAKQDSTFDKFDVQGEPYPI